MKYKEGREKLCPFNFDDIHSNFCLFLIITFCTKDTFQKLLFYIPL